MFKGSLQDFFYAPDDAIVEHHFDSVRMVWRFGEDSLNNAFCKLPCPLILLFDNADSHSAPNIRSCLTFHVCIVLMPGARCEITMPAANDIAFM